jgi:hypothetical protein
MDAMSVSIHGEKAGSSLMGDLDYVAVYELPATTKLAVTTKQAAVSPKIDAWRNHQLSSLKHGVDELCPAGPIIARLLERQIVRFQFLVC